MTMQTPFQTLEQASRRLLLADLDKAALQEKLDNVRRMLESENPELYDRMDAGAMFDIGQTSEHWLEAPHVAFSE